MSTVQLRTSIGLAGQADHPLDQIAFGRSGDLVQDDDVTPVGVVETVRELVDEHPVVGVERRVHRLALDDEVGDARRCARRTPPAARRR
jgi:hypothetical protein